MEQGTLQFGAAVPIKVPTSIHSRCTRQATMKEKKAHKRRSRSSSSSVTSSGSGSDSDAESKKRRSLARKEKKRLKKEKKKKRKEIRRLKKRIKVAAAARDRKLAQSKEASAPAPAPEPEVAAGSSGVDPEDRLAKDAEEATGMKRKAMAPMTKEEWEKQQSVVRRVTDPETGRTRLVKGDGEILEEIVSRTRHQAINRQATSGDGAYFQSQLNTRVNK